MALGIDFGTPSSGDGDTLFAAFTKINNMFSTTTKLTSGDLNINGVNVGKGKNSNYGSLAIGEFALENNLSTGLDNTAIGWSALSLNTSGDYNTAVGSNALKNSSTSNLNTAVGVASLGTNTIGFANTAIGSDTMRENLDGDYNTALGHAALNKNQSADYNTAIGTASLYSNVSGTQNTVVGADTLKTSTQGSYNTALGIFAMRQANGASLTNNIAIGASSLHNCTSNLNIAIGTGSMFNTTGGNSNTAVGSYSMESNLTGNFNTAIGRASLYLNQSGINNTALGREALSGSANISNSTGVGYNAQVTGSDQIQIGSGTTTCYTNGALQNRSDLRDKAEVRDTVLGLDFVNSLRAVDYKLDMREDYRSEMPLPLENDATDEEIEAHKILMNEWGESFKLDNITHDGTHTRTRYHHGLIAQEVKDVIEASGVDFGGFQDHKVNGGDDVLSLGYTELIAPMIKAIQELTARINVLEGN